MIFQEFALVERLTVMENLLSGRLGYTGFWPSWFRRFPGEDVARAFELLERVGLDGMENKRADALSGGQRQRVGIARALMQDPRLLLVDEPVAGLTDEETARTADLLKQLAGEHTVLVIEHDMEFIRDLQAPVTVLHEGHVLCEGSMDQVQSDPKVIEVYLGSETEGEFR
jgi:ABC-type uncharacterized transport system ATPase subunit